MLRVQGFVSQTFDKFRIWTIISMKGDFLSNVVVFLGSVRVKNI